MNTPEQVVPKQEAAASPGISADLLQSIRTGVDGLAKLDPASRNKALLQLVFQVDPDRMAKDPDTQAKANKLTATLNRMATETNPDMAATLVRELQANMDEIEGRKPPELNPDQIFGQIAQEIRAVDEAGARLNQEMLGIQQEMGRANAYLQQWNQQLWQQINQFYQPRMQQLDQQVRDRQIRLSQLNYQLGQQQQFEYYNPQQWKQSPQTLQEIQKTQWEMQQIQQEILGVQQQMQRDMQANPEAQRMQGIMGQFQTRLNGLNQRGFELTQQKQMLMSEYQPYQDYRNLDAQEVVMSPHEKTQMDALQAEIDELTEDQKEIQKNVARARVAEDAALKQRMKIMKAVEGGQVQYQWFDSEYWKEFKQSDPTMVQLEEKKRSAKTPDDASRVEGEMRERMNRHFHEVLRHLRYDTKERYESVSYDLRELERAGNSTQRDILAKKAQIAQIQQIAAARANAKQIAKAHMRQVMQQRQAMQRRAPQSPAAG